MNCIQDLKDEKHACLNMRFLHSRASILVPQTHRDNAYVQPHPLWGNTNYIVHHKLSCSIIRVDDENDADDVDDDDDYGEGNDDDSDDVCGGYDIDYGGGYDDDDGDNAIPCPPSKI